MFGHERPTRRSAPRTIFFFTLQLLVKSVALFQVFSSKKCQFNSKLSTKVFDRKEKITGQNCIL